MNDAEHAELLRREQNARRMGWGRNDYVCVGCIEAGESLDASTYLNWPAYVDSRNRGYCDRHAPGGLDIVELQPHERVNR